MSKLDSTTRLKALVVVTALLTAMVIGVAAPAKAGESYMSCGGGYGNPSVEFYLPWDGTTVQYAYRVGSGNWQYTSWYWSLSDVGAYKLTSNGWQHIYDLSFAQAANQTVVGYFRTWNGNGPSAWYFLRSCSTGAMHGGDPITYTTN